MDQTQALEVYRKYLFENPGEKDKKLPDQIRERLIRIRAAFTHWCEFPMKKESQIRDFLIDMGISRSMAYYDIQIVKRLLGNVTNAGKEWHRFRMISMVEEAYEIASEERDSDKILKAAAVLGKYTQQHIPDAEKMPFDQVVNQPFEMTSDPTVLGVEDDPDIENKIAKMKRKYNEEIDKNVEDVQYVELIDEKDGEEDLLQ